MPGDLGDRGRERVDEPERRGDEVVLVALLVRTEPDAVVVARELREEAQRLAVEGVSVG